MKTKYTKAVDKNGKTGEENSSCNYFEVQDFDQLYGTKAGTGPKYTRECGVGEDDSAKDTEDSGTCDEDQTRPKRKRTTDKMSPQNKMCFEHNLFTLPEDVIVTILSYVPLCELLQVVNRVNRLMSVIIDKHYELWSIFNFDCFNKPLGFTVRSLEYVLKHSSGFREFSVPYAIFDMCISEVDLMLTGSLSHCTKLKVLDLTGVKISTLAFLCDTKFLRTLILAESSLLNDADFTVLSKCVFLEYLSVAFTEISSATLANSLSYNAEHIMTVDAPGIVFPPHLVVSVLQMCRNIDHLHVSVPSALRNISNWNVDDINLDIIREKVVIY